MWHNFFFIALSASFLHVAVVVVALIRFQLRLLPFEVYQHSYRYSFCGRRPSVRLPFLLLCTHTIWLCPVQWGGFFPSSSLLFILYSLAVSVTVWIWFWFWFWLWLWCAFLEFRMPSDRRSGYAAARCLSRRWRWRRWRYSDCIICAFIGAASASVAVVVVAAAFSMNEPTTHSRTHILTHAHTLTRYDFLYTFMKNYWHLLLLLLFCLLLH